MALALIGAAPASAQAGPGGSATALAAYRINPGDELDIFVWGEDRLQRTVRVLPDGTFSFPLVGKVDALNALPSEIEARITKGLESQYRTAVPQVTVSVKTPAGLQFSVLGKVRSPGSFNPGRYVNVLEALSLAGGPTEFASLGNVVILRKTPTGAQAVRVRISDLMRGSTDNLSNESLPLVRGGDTVIVP
ncbi:polysaccharide biosynthesis/export family protein [Sphingomonas yunnanensis]|uniref:polysaccharide biosynthesis/export family protein n=1 Tax=Sphingomonas yunnanensis TaxID=310400 RepID=UPI001CA7A732|nr:polysaccharide biosynthesis/export family protein [Sphingomonas yunnanensis]MBY9064661.1 polysaccharide biosynthesis/export family protein [Sphingomonas yunnanensis]